MHRFRKESWVRKLEASHPKGWSTSGNEYGVFHDASQCLEWRPPSGRRASEEPTREWTPQQPYRTLYDLHYNTMQQRGGYVKGPWRFKENAQPKYGANAYKPGLKNHSKKRPHHLPPIDDTLPWIIRQNQQERHPHFYSKYSSNRDLFDFKFRTPWKPSVHG